MTHLELNPYIQDGLKGEVPVSGSMTSSNTSLGLIVSGVLCPDGESAWRTEMK